MTQAARVRLRLMLALLAPASGCIQELIVDVEPRADASQGGGLEPDSGVEEQDASTGGGEPQAGGDAQDAGGPVAMPDSRVQPSPVEDARIPDAGTMLDAAREAGPSDASFVDVPIVVLTADAGCTQATCDAGKPLGPCPGGCEINILVRPTCTDGSAEVCWSNSDGTCSYQCPNVKRCSGAGGCGADEYCYFQARDCGASGELGFCTALPKTCPSFEYGPCGCDGKRYKNGCVANLARTDVSEAPSPSMCK